MNEATATRVWRDLRTLVLERNERRREVADALGMSFFRVKALRRIATAPVTPGDLAADLMTDRPYVTLVVDDLVRRGLVERTPHPRDRRRKLLSVTPDGAAAAQEADRILGTPPPGLVELDAEELAALDRVVTKLLGSAPG
ncbi:MarR family winged helix-turn-helix transcriptional regulator [Streptomyces sp. NPDC001902]|nr:MarR family transcriptional regulator [Streptomyces sp. PA03-1a]MDX2812345.1 MarR family transcriptional regulator [Streptomyces sp. PA03-5A]